MRRKLKDVDFHVAEAFIEEDKEGGSASDCQSLRRQDSVTQTRPATEPPFSRSGSNSDDHVRITTTAIEKRQRCFEPWTKGSEVDRPTNQAEKISHRAG
ncbi:uncharacterized protein NPIL_71411 [Nephila pilipes]|uniref:Uncharacterized protein n=1 Tax=Nephila pilipes TaxID=299642 RepID=A0A8X6TZ37_NEPPI|nr:uncharacterized protein NPIL_71411 [Nephila pilipes]